MGHLAGVFPPGVSDVRDPAPGQRGLRRRPPQGRRRHPGRGAGRARRPHASPCPTTRPSTAASPSSSRSAGAWRTCSSTPPRATTSSACRPTRAPGSVPTARWATRTASTSCRWATSSGPRRWPTPSAGPGSYTGGNVPLLVTENGIGTDDDEQRIRYVQAALEGVLDCIDEGIDVRGYTYWSLLDNFEWAFGYRPRFGLVAVRPHHLRAHPQAQRRLAGRHRPRQRLAGLIRQRRPWRSASSARARSSGTS